MIGKPEWFTYRKFGWGIAPKTWQGWVYIAVLALVVGLLFSITITSYLKIWIFAIVMGVILLDIIHIMMQLPKKHDERENYHQLIIERNCSFAAIFAMLCVAIYQTMTNPNIMTKGTIPFDVSILIILGAMFLTKVVSWIYVENKQ